jgi:hypothetical protein
VDRAVLRRMKAQKPRVFPGWLEKVHALGALKRAGVTSGDADNASTVQDSCRRQRRA